MSTIRTESPPEATEPQSHGIAIQDASAWILRVGVVLGIGVMLIGVIVSFVHDNISVERMKRVTFDYRPTALFHGVAHLDGKSIVELGIYLLVLTPIMRVFTSMVLFAVEDHDWLYATVTFFVLILTLMGLLLLH